MILFIFAHCCWLFKKWTDFDDFQCRLENYSIANPIKVSFCTLSVTSLWPANLPQHCPPPAPPDVNECALGPNTPCEGHACINLVGTYRCECKPGFNFNSITRTCEGELGPSHTLETTYTMRTFLTHCRINYILSEDLPYTLSDKLHPQQRPSLHTVRETTFTIRTFLKYCQTNYIHSEKLPYTLSEKLHSQWGPSLHTVPLSRENSLNS